MDDEFAPALTMPAGQWNVLYDRVSIRGESYRLEECLRYARGAINCLKRKTPFGVTLKRQPLNPHDQHAIKVLGWWTEAGWFIKRKRTAHIGYLPTRMALNISIKHPKNTLAAYLRAIDTFDDDLEMDIVIDVLIPR